MSELIRLNECLAKERLDLSEFESMANNDACSLEALLWCLR